jgi:hypothetical protein
MAFKPSVLGGERRGEWGVKRQQNAAPFPREEGSSGQRQRTWEAAAVPDRASRGRRRSGWLIGQARLSVRGRRRGRLGRKGEGERWAAAGPEGKGERWATAGLEGKGGGRAEIQGSKRKSILIDF